MSAGTLCKMMNKTIVQNHELGGDKSVQSILRLTLSYVDRDLSMTIYASIGTLY